MPILTTAELQRLAVHFEDGYAIIPRRAKPRGAEVHPKFYENERLARAAHAELPESLRKEHKIVKARRILICSKERND